MISKRIALRTAAIAIGAAGAVGAATVPAFAASAIEYGDTGAPVACVQKAMNYLDDAGLSVDSDFGPATRSAVETYQSDHGLSADGIVGPDTGTSIKTTTAYVVHLAEENGQTSVANTGIAWENSCDSLLEGSN
jgi:peptidoglycan hydrolase-like protein with peptidoglycan-binding domain